MTEAHSSAAGPDDHSWSVRVAATGPDQAAVLVRTQRFEVGAPISFDRECPQISALEYVLGAIGADIVVSFQRLARQRRLEIDAIEATVQARLNNALTYLGVVGEVGDPAMQEVRARLFVTTPADPADVRRIWEEAQRLSPLICTFRNALRLELTLKTVS